MNNTVVGGVVTSKCFVCQPQNVNMAGSVFGGFLSKCFDTIVYLYCMTTNVGTDH